MDSKEGLKILKNFRLAIFLFALIFVCVNCIGFFGSARATGTDGVVVPAEFASFSSKYVLLYEAKSGKVLYEKRGYEKAYPASTTKVLTAIIAIEKGDLEAEVTIGDRVETKGSSMGLKPGERLKLKDLLYGMMLVSGNDAARAIAEHISGSVADFAVIMNEYCATLGMKDTQFKNPNGLDNTEHFTTAYDLALASAYAMKNPTFRQVVSTQVHTIPSTNRHSEGFILENTNRFIHKKVDDKKSFLYEYATGIKTGDTMFAGKCIVTSAKKGDMELIAVLFGDMDDNSTIGENRYVAAKSLFDFGFNNFELVNIADLGLSNTVTCNVSDSLIKQTTLNIDLENSFACIPKSDVQDIRENASKLGLKIVLSNSESENELKAPVDAGEAVGSLQYLYNDEVIFTAALTTSEKIQKSDESTSAGQEVEAVEPPETPDYSWLFWLLTASIGIVIVIVVIQLSRRKPRRAKYSRPNKYRVRRRM